MLVAAATGSAALRDAMDVWAIDDRPPDSVLELRMARLLRDHGLPRPSSTAGWPASRSTSPSTPTGSCWQCDGWDAHGRDRRQFERDRERDPTLIAAGWLILRFTWVQITRRPAWVASMIRQAIATRQAA